MIQIDRLSRRLNRDLLESQPLQQTTIATLTTSAINELAVQNGEEPGSHITVGIARVPMRKRPF
ncbi:hypothetical protein BGI51_22420 [Pseudomonas oryzihabitans]|nr:hypothetical protein BGI51_22420 [Pseudomonas psychrotolerans]